MVHPAIVQVIFNIGGLFGVLPFVTTDSKFFKSCQIFDEDVTRKDVGASSSTRKRLIVVRRSLWLISYFAWVLVAMTTYSCIGGSNVVGDDTKGLVQLHYLVTATIVICSNSSAFFILNWKRLEETFELFNELDNLVISRKTPTKKVLVIIGAVISCNICFCVACFMEYFSAKDAQLENLGSTTMLVKELLGNEIQSAGLWLLIATAQEKFQALDGEFQEALSSRDFLYIAKLRHKYITIRRYLMTIQDVFGGVCLVSLVRLMIVTSVAGSRAYSDANNNRWTAFTSTTVMFFFGCAVSYATHFSVADSCESTAQKIIETFDLNEGSTFQWRRQVLEIQMFISNHPCEFMCARTFPLNWSSFWKELQFLVTFMVILLQLSQTDAPSKTFPVQ